MTTLGDIAEIASGKRPLVVFKRPQAGASIPVVGGGGVSGFTNAALYECGALITGRVGTLGQLHNIRGPCWPSDNALVILPKPGVGEIFLRYSVAAEIANAAGMNRGAANPLITQTDLKRLPVPDCSIETQAKLGEILGLLESRVELNHQINKSLELMAQAIFQDWCVDLGPTRRLGKGVKDPVELLGGLTPDAKFAAEILRHLIRSTGHSAHE